jgi:RNA polymerase sigma-70 factor (ECF subfamily)
MYEKEIPEREQRELIKRAKECDPAAFATIYEHYYQDIYNYIYHRVANAQLAEDLTSDVFLKVLESIGSFTFRGIPFSAWLFRLARNLMIDRLRTHPELAELSLEEELLPAEGGADVALERKLTRQQLLQALRSLTEEQQEVIILKFIDGLSNTDVARILGKSEGAVKALQHRALSALSRFFEIE